MTYALRDYQQECVEKIDAEGRQGTISLQLQPGSENLLFSRKLRDVAGL